MPRRFNVVVSTTRNGRRSSNVFNNQPLRPGSVPGVFRDAVDDVYNHLSRGGKVFVHGVQFTDTFVVLVSTDDDLRTGVSVSVKPKGN